MTHGTMERDSEVKIDYDRLRRERLERAKAQLKKSGLGAFLCFDNNNIRYITGTTLGVWTKDKMCRFTILPRGGDPVHFEVGSAARVKNELCPWLKGKVQPSVTWMRGVVPSEVKAVERFMDILKAVLGDHGVLEEPLGIDIWDVPLYKAITKADIRVEDGQEPLLDCRRIKTKDEIEIMKLSAAMVDAAYDAVVRFIKPGVRENEIVALVNEILYSQGADEVEFVNCVTGDRTNPHPHDFSDRMVRPGDLIFMDIGNVFNGYRTCYYRTFICGEPTPKQREIYKKCITWLYDSIEEVKPGNTTGDIASRWPKAEELGFADERAALFLQFGHGVGMSIWEKPVVSRLFSIDNPFPLEENMLFALETYCGSEDGSFGARIEEEIVVTADGHEVITKYPCKELVVCG